MVETVYELLKLIVPALASSGVVAAFYQRRQKKFEAYEPVMRQLLEGMIRGAEVVITKLRRVDSVVRGLEVIVQSEITDESRPHLAQGTKELMEGAHDLSDAISNHRIYITELVPFGDSSPLLGSLAAIANSCDLLRRGIQDEEVLAIAVRSMGAFYENQDAIYARLNDVKTQLKEGRGVA